MASKKKKRPTPPPPPVRTAPPRAKAESGPSKRQLEQQAAEKAAARDGLRRKLVAGGLVLGAGVAVATYFVVDRRNDAALRDELTAGSCRVDEDSDPTDASPGNHVASPVYTVDPPAGGNHLGSGATASGAYAGARVPADGLLVHSLEHGYVVLWHQAGLPAEQVQQLVDVQEANGTDVIVAERSTLSVPVAATSWGQRLLCGAVEPEALQRFVEERVGNGPEDVERT